MAIRKSMLTRNLKVMLYVLIIASIGLRCEPPCLDNKGYLELENDSQTTKQKILINGTDYGTLDPKESETYNLNPGTYNVEFVGIHGGKGCSVFTIVIACGQSEGRVCRN